MKSEQSDHVLADWAAFKKNLGELESQFKRVLADSRMLMVVARVPFVFLPTASYLKATPSAAGPF